MYPRVGLRRYNLSSDEEDALMDHVVIDPRGYWAHTGEAELIAHLAVRVERARWQAVLAKHLPPETCRLVSHEVLADPHRPIQLAVEEVTHEDK